MPDQASFLTPETMTRDEQSCMLYLETVAVDFDGFLEGIRMNEADHNACKKFVELGLIQYGRVPYSMIKSKCFSRAVTHWVTFKPTGWLLAHQLRIARADLGLRSSKRQTLAQHIQSND